MQLRPGKNCHPSATSCDGDSMGLAMDFLGVCPIFEICNKERHIEQPLHFRLLRKNLSNST